MQKKGYVSFVLHAHLPFIHHPESDDYLEESWLYEAISETYIPLLQNFQKLVDEGVKFRITMSITPTLLSMLDNKLLQKKYINYLNQLIELSEKEIERTKYDERVNTLSHYYYDRYSNDLHLFRDVWNCNIIEQFKHFQDSGVLEIIACGATHGYFPILYVTEETIRAQVAVGVQTYEKYFGKPIPIDNLIKEEMVFNEKLVYSSKESYKDGVSLSVTDDYLVPSQLGGIVVFVGEKEGYGKTVVVQQYNGIDLWYGNMENINVELYDYIEKGSLIGSVNKKLYLVYKKNGKVLDYNEQI